MTPHLVIGYSGYTHTGRYIHSQVTLDLDSLEAIKRGQFDLNRLLLDVDNIVEEHETAIKQTCPVCNGARDVWGYVGVEPVKEACPACQGDALPESTT